MIRQLLRTTWVQCTKAVWVCARISARLCAGTGQRLRGENPLGRAILHTFTPMARAYGATYAWLPIGIKNLRVRVTHLPRVVWGECTPKGKVFRSITFRPTSG